MVAMSPFRSYWPIDRGFAIFLLFILCDRSIDDTIDRNWPIDHGLATFLLLFLCDRSIQRGLATSLLFFFGLIDRLRLCHLPALCFCDRSIAIGRPPPIHLPALFL